MSFKAECNLCKRTWKHDQETKKCFWCGNESFRLIDRLPTGEEFTDEDTEPGRPVRDVWDDLIKDLDP